MLSIRTTLALLALALATGACGRKTELQAQLDSLRANPPTAASPVANRMPAQSAGTHLPVAARNYRIAIVMDSSGPRTVSDVVGLQVNGTDSLRSVTAYNPKTINDAIAMRSSIDARTYKLASSTSTPPVVNFESRGLVYLNDTIVDAAAVNAIKPGNVDHIEVLRSPAVLGHYADPRAKRGVILVWTRK